MTDKFNNLINKATLAVQLKTENQTYQPGVCNIGPAQREKRRVLAIFGGMFGFSWPFLGYVFVFPIWLQILVFFPAFIGVLSFLQYRDQFCAYYALTNKYNFSDTQKPYNVVDKKEQNINQDKALNMIIKSLAISFGYTLLAILLF
jgi:hypothetical protein